MKVPLRTFGFILKRWFVSSLFVSSSVVCYIQLADWVNRNGWSWHGYVVNHFGEHSEGTVVDWMYRIFSPFALPVVVGIFLLSASSFFLVSRIFHCAFRRVERAGTR